MDIQEFVKPLTSLEEEAIAAVEGFTEGVAYVVRHADEAAARCERAAFKVAGALCERRVRVALDGPLASIVKVLPALAKAPQ